MSNNLMRFNPSWDISTFSPWKNFGALFNDIRLKPPMPSLDSDLRINIDTHGTDYEFRLMPVNEITQTLTMQLGE